MSADWFYIGRGGIFRRKKTIGPLSNQEVLSRIDAGEITPETLLRSQQKTRDRWVEMKTVGPAYEHYQRTQPQPEPEEEG
jgi:hypothetical protein